MRMIGIIEEQHPDRCRLFMQWQQMNWPILVDALNRLQVKAVPITLLIDEQGIIRTIGPGSGDLKDFLAGTQQDNSSATESVPTPEPIPAARPDLVKLTQLVDSGSLNALRGFGDAVVEWGKTSELEKAIEAYRRVLAKEPFDGITHFHLGVAYRRRFESQDRRPRDFSRAVEHWAKALDLDPNQYIWRRRIQQYGPRLDKPYPFYDWINQARREIRARGEIPFPLSSEPSGAEFATPQSDLTKAGKEASEPDPQDRITRDERGFIQVETTVVPSTPGSRAAARVHLVFRPDRSIKAHWDNEADGLLFWIDPPEGWTVDRRYHQVPNPPEPVSTAVRKIEFEVFPINDDRSAPGIIKGYALYYVCEDVDGTCLYRRQDVTVVIPPSPPR